MTFFRRFGGSATFTEASAEPVRPNLAEASAEASVSVVHYLQVTITCLLTLLFSWNHEHMAEANSYS